MPPSFAVVEDAAHHDSKRAGVCTGHLVQGDILIYINPVVNGCGENHLRNIPNLCMTACVASDKSEFHLPHFRVFRGLKL
jgi:hypothetical protein